MIRKLLCFALCLFLFAASSLAADISLEGLLAKIQANQSKINDMYAETTTTIISNLALPGAEEKGPQKIVQKGKIWAKGKDKSKIEMTSPMQQITITNGDRLAIIQPATGQKFVQDLSEIREKQGIAQSSGPMNLDTAKQYFDLSVIRSGEEYVIQGIPKEENKILKKMEFYIDAERWVPIKILMYGSSDKVMSRSDIEYAEISGVWVPSKNFSNVMTPAGVMEVEMEFENIQVNKGINDNEFAIN